ncbi:MAG TPA: membrane dipeptidase [Anaerolineales bacterium]|nr:membrane dipeptidase [Anaerolineales bacterium]
MYLIDAHQDLAYNVLEFGRDYTRSAAETRALEAENGSLGPIYNGLSMLGWPDFLAARTAVVFATLFAAPERGRLGAWQEIVYRTPDEAHRLYRDQLDVYHRLFDDHPDKFSLVADRAGLAAAVERAGGNEPFEGPVGMVLLMEGAEGIRSVDELELWWEGDVRVIGPAWIGTRFCGGTREPGPLTAEGQALLEGMADFGFALDLSHMDEQAALEALDRYEGPLLASHANCLSLLKGSDSNRHLSDRVIAGIVERGGVIGAVPYNAFLKAGWKRGDDRAEVILADLVAHIDHVCQIAGDAGHAGIGSDFEGGFGRDETPTGLDTIADLHAIAPLLEERGYGPDDIAGIMGGNWARLMDRALPD